MKLVRWRILHFVGLLAVSLWAGPLAGQPRGETPRILVNARIWTGNPDRPWADAVALRGDRIIAVGAEREVMLAAGEGAAREDMGGGFLVPGFIDGHTHFASAGRLLLGVNLLDVASDEAFRRRVTEAHHRLPPGSWMVGGDWGAYDLETSWVPNRPLIESLVGSRPTLLNKWDRSQFLANAAALSAARIDPAGHDGLLTPEEAQRVREAMPPPSFEQRLAEARLAFHDLVRHGVTSFHDNTSADQLRLYRHLEERDSLPARVCARPQVDTWEQLAVVGIQNGFGSEWVNICGLKGHIDGIMGNSSAMFREPYRHMPDTRGRWRRLLSPPGTMERHLAAADSVGLTAHVHAIGDLAVDTLLDMFETVIERNGPRDRRLRMIHAQVVEDDDFVRFGELGIIAEINPYHAIDDMRWMEDRIGVRSRGAYPFRSLKDGGALLVFGSDWPGTNAAWYPADPVLLIYAAVTRKTLDGEPAAGWYPEQRLTVQEALEAHTVAAAYAAFEEDWKGKIEPGYVADLAVLSQNLFEIPLDDIKNVRVWRTMTGGRWVYTAEDLIP
jgi:predicted amidohydrolase YtcJ